MLKQLVSKKGVADNGEDYPGEGESMPLLDLVQQETQRIDPRFLEPACGTDNFLIEILRRKLSVMESRFKRSQSDYERYVFLGISSLYGIGILKNNIKTCRKRLFDQLNEPYFHLYQRKAKPVSGKSSALFSRKICSMAMP